MKHFIRPRLSALFHLIGIAVFLASIVWPTVAMLVRVITAGEAPDGGLTISTRQWGLLERSIGLSLGAMAVSHLISLLPAYLLSRQRRLSDRTWPIALILIVLLSPPIVSAFGWERLLPPTFDANLRCILVWSLWIWPIPALLLGAGWSRLGRSAYEAALVNASSFSAFFRVALPSLGRHLAVSALLVFLFCLHDYNVPHACGLMVYATELLGWAAGSTRMIDTLWPAVPGILLSGSSLLLILWIWRRRMSAGDADATLGPPPRTVGSASAAFVFLFVVTWLLPVGFLIGKLATPRGMKAALTIYGGDLAMSIVTALAAGIGSVVMGLSLTGIKPMRRIALVWAIMFGAVPGALVGNALVAAYNHGPTGWIYDQWPIIVLGYIARYGWMGILAAWLAIKSGGAAMIEQARTDGASPFRILILIRFPLQLPVLVGAMTVVMALSLSDAATTSLIRVPSFSPIALVLIEKFHRFEDGMLVSISLWMVTAALIPAILIAATLRIGRSGRQA